MLQLVPAVPQITEISNESTFIYNFNLDDIIHCTKV